MDYEYNDDADENEIEHFAFVIKAHSFSEDEVKNVLKHMLSNSSSVVKCDLLTKDVRQSDISNARISRICKSESSHIFKIQLPNFFSFILRFNSERTLDSMVKIMSSVRGAGVPVPLNYSLDSKGVIVGKKTYYVLLQEHIDGMDFQKAAHSNLLTPSNKEIALANMGRMLKNIHSIKEIEGISTGNQNSFYADALERLDSDRELILSEEICTKEDFEDIYKKAESLSSISKIFASQSYGLVHFDYHPKNIIIERSGTSPEIKAILTWSEVDFSNKYLDFALWDYWCGEDFLIDSLLEGYGLEAFASAESKLNVALTTIAALIKEFCDYAHNPDLKASQFGIWQRLTHEVREATY